MQKPSSETEIPSEAAHQGALLKEEKPGSGLQQPDPATESKDYEDEKTIAKHEMLGKEEEGSEEAFDPLFDMPWGSEDHPISPRESQDRVHEEGA